MEPPPPRCQPPLPPGIAIGTLNIRDDRVFGIVQVILVVDLGRFDLMVLTETNISTTMHC